MLQRAIIDPLSALRSVGNETDTVLKLSRDRYHRPVCLSYEGLNNIFVLLLIICLTRTHKIYEEVKFNMNSKCTSKYK